MKNKKTDAHDKQSRQKAILEILSTEEAGTQEELVAAIQKRGFTSTQTTISRDLAEMNIFKLGRMYRNLSDNPIDSLERTFTQHVLQYAQSGDSMVVLRTRTGTAQPVAIELDKAQWKEVVGTLAGDDTIFIAVKGKKEVPSVLKKIKRLVPSGGML